MGERPWTAMTDGVVVRVRLTPKGGRDSIEGLERLADGQTVLKARVRAAPSDGEANAALERLLAVTLGIGASRVDVIAGATARVKRVKIAGNPAAISAALERTLAAMPQPPSESGDRNVRRSHAIGTRSRLS